MKELKIKNIYQNAFETFKVFETIPFEISGILIENQTSTIWQILNHLIIWQKFHIEELNNIEKNIKFNESKSWISEIIPKDILEWKTKISEFENQIEIIKNIVETLNFKDEKINEKMKIIQDSSTHLSFHLGEIILIGRQKNKYPQPSEMNEFLK